jgi:hypothetical protein
MSRARRRTVKALVVLGSLLAFLSVFAIWTERQALNTNDWVDTSGRLIQNEEIRAAVGEYLVDQLYANVDVEKELEGILPGELKQLAGPASGGLRQVAGSGAEEVLKTSTAQELWKDANRAAHEQLLAVLENKKEAVSTANGEVTLNLGGLVTNLAQQVGIGVRLAEKLPPDAGQVTILRSNQLKTAQDVVVGIKGLALLLSLLTLLAFGLAVYLSRDGRWVTVLFCGIGLAAAGFAAIVFREVAGGIVVGQLVKEESVKPAAEAAWSISTSLMVSIATTLIVFGALLGIAGWLGSPTGSARSTRRFMAPALRDYAPYVYTAWAIVVCIYFLSSSIQNLRSFLTTLIVAGFVAVGIHELRKQSDEEFPDAQFADYFGGAKARVVDAVKSANLGERAAKLRLPEARRPSAGAPAAGPAAAPAADEEDNRLRRLERLAELHGKGVLTEEEFAAEKARVLGEARPRT